MVTTESGQSELKFNPQLLIDFLVENGMEDEIIQEIKEAIENSKNVKDEHGVMEFFKRNTDLI